MTIDWPGIRAAAIALNSARGAAVQAAALLPPEERQRFIHRVNKRAYRERWLSKARQLQKPRDNGSLPLSQPVLSGHEVLTQTLQRDNEQTRLSLSKATRKASQNLAQREGAEVVKSSRNLKDIAESASKVHGWNVGQGTNVAVQINFQEENDKAQELWKRLRALPG